MGKLVLDRHRERMILDELYRRAREHIDSPRHIELIDWRTYSSFSHLKKILENFIPSRKFNITTIDTANKVITCLAMALFVFSRYRQAPLSIFEVMPWLCIIPSFYVSKSVHKHFDKIMEVYNETLYYEPLGENFLV